MPLSPPSEKESIFYYAGLPSGPRLVARSGTVSWSEPTGMEAYRVIRMLHPVGDHAVKEVWEDNLALKLHALLDSMEVKWTSTDVVRIGNAEEPYKSAPVILWIGVTPASLSGADGVVVASKCKELLVVEYSITDVDVEIRQSIVARSAGPKLLQTGRRSFDPTREASIPLTSTLGLPICAQSTPSTEGTGGFFITEGENTERLLLVSARHVVFPPDEDENKHFERKDDSQRRYNVTLFGDAAFNNYLNDIKTRIRGQGYEVDYQEQRLEGAEEEKELEDAQSKLKSAKKSIERLNSLSQDISTHWTTPENRILGHVVLSPPIKFGAGSSSEGYTEDWAVIEIDASKIDASNFDGNAIDLGPYTDMAKFVGMMNPTYRRDHPFKYPHSHLLRLTGTIPDEEMRYPPILDPDEGPYTKVIKRSSTSGLSVGRANDVFSYARYYDDDSLRTKASKEWAILPFDSSTSRPFSEMGDSGSVVVDCHGRMGGLLTGGAGKTDDLDLTYATPVNFLLKCIEACGIRAPNTIQSSPPRCIHPICSKS
ncbi:hypothetical protein EVG20_g2313 [Dentipellis fragilis]|uniref:Uncharacterized protein n=1 Tax=Dentipellis fragilis TaxID=205917 RepID=A0A4Y9ZA68_9AGAM|nr:hypothetical protein EVG20_g2313 [Dentipellis fragilis]